MRHALATMKCPRQLHRSPSEALPKETHALRPSDQRDSPLPGKHAGLLALDKTLGGLPVPHQTPSHNRFETPPAGRPIRVGKQARLPRSAHRAPLTKDAKKDAAAALPRVVRVR